MGVLDRGATLSISDGGTVEKSWRPRIKKPYLIVIGILLLLVFIVAILFFAGVFQNFESPQVENPTKPLPPSVSLLHTFSKAAVCADGPPCAEIGKQILERNGSAVDATIAAMFCNGLINMQSMGMGGGFLMTIYIKKENKAYSLNAREVAPLAATKDMFGEDQSKSRKGPLSIGIPGELKGYWAAHKRFGHLPWRQIIQPTIDLCEKGYKLTIPQHKSLANDLTNVNKLYKEWFFVDGVTKKVGDIVRPQQLCETLKLIAENGGEDFYSGKVSDMIAEDLKNAGSIITKEDLRKYNVVWSDAITTDFNNGDTLYSVPPPGSGVLLAYILKVLDGFNFNRESLKDDKNRIITYHRIIEAFKHAYSKRTELADTNFVDIEQLIANLTSPQFANLTRLKISDQYTSQNPKFYGASFFNNLTDNGTAHISVMAENGDAVSVTSTINLYFGSEIVSESTGITFNSVMDDFSSPGFVNYFNLPGSPNNAIQPGKRPLSSMSPSIIIDKNGTVKLVIGASGGTQITTSIAQVIMRVLWFGENIKEAVDAPRLHHQVYPMSVGYEYGTLQQVIDGLEKLGHKTYRLSSFSVICALVRNGNIIFANADHRKGGDVRGIGKNLG